MNRIIVAAVSAAGSAARKACGTACASQLPTELPSTKFNSGQDVQPYFEGWIHNKDGSFDLVFGYFNRNWQEELAIPAGPDNIDRARRTRSRPADVFPARRQGWVYRVRVPADFGKGVVTWTIKANGKTQKAYGELLPVEEITERIVMTRGNLNPGDDDPNKPPTITIAPIGAPTIDAPITLTASVADDGLPKPRAAGAGAHRAGARRRNHDSGAGELVGRRSRAAGLSVTWMQLRGPGKVTLRRPDAIAVADGKAETTARSPSAGTYVLRATANDGALSTRADVTIAVRGAA